LAGKFEVLLPTSLLPMPILTAFINIELTPEHLEFDSPITFILDLSMLPCAFIANFENYPLLQGWRRALIVVEGAYN
jgi:hypothetical protein